MLREKTQHKIGNLIVFSIISITLFITPYSTIDPINLPKMWLLAALSFAILGAMLPEFKNLILRENKIVLLASFFFLLALVLSIAISTSPVSQQIFGTFGRQTGLLTYVAFVILFIASATATNPQIRIKLLFGFSFAIGSNAIYAFTQAIGKDPVNWSNSYSPVIGTFGNPNFVSAFLGFGIALSLSYLFASSVKLKYRIISMLYIILAIYDILRSDSQQGLILSLLSLGLVTYFALMRKILHRSFKLLYLLMGFSAFIIGVAGTLQKGPLASILYSKSVTYRGDYWHAGIDMFMNNLFFGVGLDSYGDWYRASRTLEATLRRGPSVTSSAAHNVFIDLAAGAGIFALAAYLLIIFLGLQAAYQISRQAKKFDPFFVSIFVAWMGYLLQSTISINNIAIAIWGWILPGILISMNKWESYTKDNTKKPNVNKARARRQVEYSGIGLFVGFLFGSTVGFLPFNSDANFRHSIETGNADKIYRAALKWPTDSKRINYASQIFDQNKMPDKAVELARESVKQNPRNFDGWYYLYKSPLVSDKEKREVFDRLKALDPHNPDLKKSDK